MTARLAPTQPMIAARKPRLCRPRAAGVAVRNAPASSPAPEAISSAPATIGASASPTAQRPRTFSAIPVALVERRLSLARLVLALAVALALALVFDLPFEDLLLPPNGDV